MNFSEPERTIVNLGILGQINKNVKISTYGNYLTLQDPIPIVTPLVRWSYGDKKGKTVSRIKEIIDQAKVLLDSGHLDAQTVHQLEDGLHAALSGLQNLQFTYYQDPKTSAQIRLIHDKVVGILRDRGYEFETVSARAGSAPTESPAPAPKLKSRPSTPRPMPVPSTGQPPSESPAPSPKPKSMPATPPTAPVKRPHQPSGMRPRGAHNTPSASEEGSLSDYQDSSSSSKEEEVTETLPGGQSASSEGLLDNHLFDSEPL